MSWSLATVVSGLLLVPVLLINAFIVIPLSGSAGWWQLGLAGSIVCGSPFLLAWMSDVCERLVVRQRPVPLILDMFGGTKRPSESRALWILLGIIVMIAIATGGAMLLEHVGAHPVTLMEWTFVWLGLVMIPTTRLSRGDQAGASRGEPEHRAQSLAVLAGWTGMLGRRAFAMRLLYAHALQEACCFWLPSGHRSPITAMEMGTTVPIMFGMIMIFAGWIRVAACARRSRDAGCREVLGVMAFLGWLIEIVGHSIFVLASVIPQLVLLTWKTRPGIQGEAVRPE